MMRKKSCMPNGNMIKDRNKGISNIRYNHLNLPTQIEFEGTNDKITYLYNSVGQKLKKTVVYSDSIKIVDYLDGFQYAGGELNFFPHPEGYVSVKRGGRTAPDGSQGYVFNYVFNYTDHLGNIRVSYSKDPQTNQLKILEENHYYPFGLKHSVYTGGRLRDFEVDFSNPEDEHVFLTPVTKTEYQYKYNGKEWQDELGLGWYDYHARNYDPALGRWQVIDPMAPKYFSHSPYSYALNNPVYFIDPDGMQVGPGDEIINEDDPIVLETAVITAKAPEKTSSSSGFSLAYIPRINMTDYVFGRDGRNSINGAYTNMNRSENIDGYRKMQKAKRDGEWFAVGALGGSIVLIYTAPAVITYGTVAISAEVEMLSLYGSGAWKTALATPFGQMALKSTIDATAQGLFNDGKVNPVAAIVGGAVPGSSWGAAVKSGIASEATSLYMENSANPGSVGVKDILTSGVKSAIAAPGGMHMGNFVESAVGNSVAGEVGGAIFSNYLSSEIEDAK